MHLSLGAAARAAGSNADLLPLDKEKGDTFVSFLLPYSLTLYSINIYKYK